MVALDYAEQHVAHCRRAVEMLYLASGATHPSDITADELERWLDAQPSPKTAANRRSYVGAYLDWCMGRGLVERNVARAVRTRRPRPGKGADIIRQDQLSMVVARLGRRHSESGGDRRCTALYRSLCYRFLWATMIRVSELHSITWDEIDFDARTLRMRMDKARRADAIPLSDDAIAVLWQLHAGHVPMPRNRGAGLSYVFPLKISAHTMHADLKAVGVDGRGAFHRLRKGAITACIEAGVPVHLLAKLSRHANVSVLVQSYYVASDPLLRDAQRALRLGVA